MSANQTQLNSYAFAACTVLAILSYVYTLDIAFFLEAHIAFKSVLWGIFLVAAVYWGVFVRISRPYDFGVTACIAIPLVTYAYTLEIAFYLDENAAFKALVWGISFASASTFFYPISQRAS